MTPQSEPLTHYRWVIRRPLNNLNFTQITEQQTRTMIAKMRPTKSTVVDGIRMCTIIKNKDILTKPLTNLINVSIATNTYPEALKVNKVVPVLKPKKDPFLPGSYRLINLCPATSKIIETHLQTQLINHLETNGLITHQHHRARKNHSIATEPPSPTGWWRFGPNYGRTTAPPSNWSLARSQSHG